MPPTLSSHTAYASGGQLFVCYHYSWSKL